MARTRKNPHATGDMLALAVVGMVALLAWPRLKGLFAAPGGGEGINFPSGDVLGVATSGASGITSSTSHPGGHGQIYV